MNRHQTPGAAFVTFSNECTIMKKRILVVLTSCEKYPTLNRATGLWLGEAVHFVLRPWFDKTWKPGNLEVVE